MITVSLNKAVVAAVAAGGLLMTGIAVAAASPDSSPDTIAVVSDAAVSSTASATGTPHTDADDAADDADDADSDATGTHTANPASTLKGDNGWIHSEGRNSVGASRRDGLPKPTSSKTHDSDESATDGDSSDGGRPSTSKPERTSPRQGKGH